MTRLLRVRLDERERSFAIATICTAWCEEYPPGHPEEGNDNIGEVVKITEDYGETTFAFEGPLAEAHCAELADWCRARGIPVEA